jgi:hypothetical protein
MGYGPDGIKRHKGGHAEKDRAVYERSSVCIWHISPYVTILSFQIKPRPEMVLNQDHAAR